MASKVETKPTICQICHKTIIRPRILPCLHTFCEKCIRDLIERGRAQDSVSGPKIRAKFFIGAPSSQKNSSTDSESTSVSDHSAESSSSGKRDSWSIQNYSTKSKQFSPVINDKRRSASIILTNHSIPTVQIHCPACNADVLVASDIRQLDRDIRMEFKLFLEQLNYNNTGEGEGRGPIPCDSCLETSPASSKCLSCEEHLCSLCSTAHQRQKRTSRHLVMTLNNNNRQFHHVIKEVNSTKSNSINESACDSRGDNINPNSPSRLNIANVSFDSQCERDSPRTILSTEHNKANINSVSQNGNNGTLFVSPSEQHHTTTNPDISADNNGLLASQSNGDITRTNSGWPHGHDTRRTKPTSSDDVVRSSNCSNENEHQVETTYNGDTLEFSDLPIYCEEHVREKLKLFCESCQKLICRDCVVMYHRHHDCTLLDGVSKDRTTIREMKTWTDEINKNLDHLNSSRRQITSSKCEIESHTNSTEMEINAFLDAYVVAIDQHRSHLLQKLESLRSDKVKLLDIRKNELDSIVEKYSNMVSFIGNLTDKGSVLEILSLKRTVIDRMSVLDQRMAEIGTGNGACNSEKFASFSASQPAAYINGYPMYGVVYGRNVCPARCNLETDGLATARVGMKCRVKLLLSAEDGDSLHPAETHCNIDASLIPTSQTLSISQQRGIPVKIQPREKCSQWCVKMAFTPQTGGVHRLYVNVNEQRIKDSPFMVTVKRKWRQHTGIWHCCSFCSSALHGDVICACPGTMPGGYIGCGHSYSGHPGGEHWSCCGKLSKTSECGHVTGQQQTLPGCGNRGKAQQISV